MKETEEIMGMISPASLEGSFFEPTILVDVPKNALVSKDETFGPLAPVFRFKDEAEVIAMSNDTEFGLASYFYARDLARVFRVAEQLEYGMVGINTGLISVAEVPFGGVPAPVLAHGAPRLARRAEELPAQRLPHGRGDAEKRELAAHVGAHLRPDLGVGVLAQQGEQLSRFHPLAPHVGATGNPTIDPDSRPSTRDAASRLPWMTRLSEEK